MSELARTTTNTTNMAWRAIHARLTRAALGARSPAPTGTRRWRVLAALVPALALAVAAAPAVAATPAPAWSITSTSFPTNFSASDNAGCSATPGDCDSYVLRVTNVGSEPTAGTVTITDTLPAGLTVEDVIGSDSLTGNALTCTTTISPLQCTDTNVVPPGDILFIEVTVEVTSATGSVTNAATVQGGGAATVSAAARPTVISGTPAPFGASAFNVAVTGVDGAPDTQAADHPYAVTTSFDLNSEVGTAPGDTFAGVSGNVKDVVVDLPLGLVGNPTAAPECPFSDFVRSGTGTGGAQQLNSTECPVGSEIGTISASFLGSTTGGSTYLASPSSDAEAISGTKELTPVYNMVPERGYPAEFGFQFKGYEFVMYPTVVDTPAGYVLQVVVPGVTHLENVELSGASLTIWGDPADPSHDDLREDDQGNLGLSSSEAPSAFFTNPSVCSGQGLSATIHVDSWQNPAPVPLNADGSPDLAAADFSDPQWQSATSTLPPVTGCNALQFKPTMTVQPDTTVADSASGLHVDIAVPQSEDPDTLATPPLKDASVTLPPGFTVNPSSAAGLEACTASQIALGSSAPPTCPAASQIGTVQLTTPILPGTLSGEIYLASEFDNPFHSLLAGYIVIDDPTTGIVLKIPGNLTPNPLTGQITGVFDNNPQFPFSDLKLDFKGGPTGVLATPESCGAFSTTSVFSPWSAPDSGPPATLSDSFQINSGCVSGFAPSFTAGTQDAQAGHYSPFVVSLTRADTDQNFQGLVVKLPPGMLAKLAGVDECSEQALASISSQPGTGQNEINNPSCPSNSQVGTVTTGAGTGPDPFYLGGKAYLTGPYKGAPYGLAVVVPAVAGPLDLGTVVVRQALYVDPTTAQVTDVSDPFPTILDGIPLRIRRVDVNLNRPDFTLNPTSCDPMSVTGTATSTQGTNANLSSPFQVGGCSALAFSPKLKIALTGKGKTRSGDHPTLTATLTQPFGQANIQTARVALPLSLALDPNNSQHVCDYDIALAVHGGGVGCPASTIVGTATAVTPLLSEPLTGPVYLVQGIRFGAGGERIRTLPSLLIPLRGQIALDLRAQSSVNGAQQLVTTFSTIPDAAVSKFTLTITGGKKGLLVITGRGRTICNRPQVTGAAFGAQSGKTENSSVKMSTPCRAVKHKKKHAMSKRHAVKHDVFSPVPDRRL